MAESFANLYVISYIKSTKRQFSYLEVAIAVFTLERSQFLLKFLYVAVKYIFFKPTMSKMDYGKSIAAIFYHIYYQEFVKRTFESRL
jgi:hypothetical protein